MFPLGSNVLIARYWSDLLDQLRRFKRWSSSVGPCGVLPVGYLKLVKLCTLQFCILPFWGVCNILQGLGPVGFLQGLTP